MRTFAKFAAISLSATAMDLVIFQFLLFVLQGFSLAAQIWAATVVARIISSTYRFFMNKRLVFHDPESAGVPFVKFWVLTGSLMAASATFVYLLTLALPIPSVVIKLGVDLCLFFVSFFFQKTWVFKGRLQASSEQAVTES